MTDNANYLVDLIGKHGFYAYPVDGRIHAEHPVSDGYGGPWVMETDILEPTVEAVLAWLGY